MSTILEFLGSDHRACDDLFASAEAAAAQKNWDSARSLFDRFQAAMAHHLSMEETVLFPAFEARTGKHAGPDAGHAHGARADARPAAGHGERRRGRRSDMPISACPKRSTC